MVSPELQALTEIGFALLVATVDDHGEPRASRAWSGVLDPVSGRLRLVVSADDPTTVANLARGPIAVTGADVRTLKSVQVKGRVVLVEDVNADDLARMTLHCDAFFTGVMETDNTPRAQLERLLPERVLACEFEVTEAYDQSPGPTAGEARAVRP